MKKIIILCLIALFAIACSTSKFTSDGAKEKKYIDVFLTYMDVDNGPEYQNMMNCISPKYIKEKGIEVTDYKVDNYSITGHSIESYTSEGYVVAKIWGKNRSWVHELTFKLSIEGGKIYIYPSGNSDSYIYPWWERITYIDE